MPDATSARTEEDQAKVLLLLPGARSGSLLVLAAVSAGIKRRQFGLALAAGGPVKPSERLWQPYRAEELESRLEKVEDLVTPENTEQ
jgi:hypothetical protein